MNHESLRTLCESHSPEEVSRTLGEAMEAKKIKPSDINLRVLAYGLIGENAETELKKYAAYKNPTMISEAVGVTNFRGITGQIFFTTVMDGFATAPRELTSRVRTVKSRLSGEKIPLPGASSRYGYDITEGEQFPEDGFGRHWIETPRSAKSGKLIRLTWEAVFFDRVGFVLETARDIGMQLQESKEIRICAALSGVTAELDEGKTFNGNTFKWCKPTEDSATAYDTYQTTATGAGINKKASVTFASETDIEALVLLATDMTHPDTGRPAGYAAQLNAIVCTPKNARRIRRAMNATEVRTGTDPITIAPRGIANYEVIESVHLYNTLVNSGISAANAAEHFYLVNLNKAIYYIENEALDVQEQGALGDKAFENDLVWTGRAKEMGTPAVVSPWHMYQSING